jgi:hypothetical protein
MKTDKSETHLNEKTIRLLQRVRRANEAILGCIQVLREDGVNEACCASVPGVFIRLEAAQRAGLEFAVETCAEAAASVFDEHLEDLGVHWTEEICPEVTANARAVDDLKHGRMTYEELEQEVSH